MYVRYSNGTVVPQLLSLSQNYLLFLNLENNQPFFCTFVLYY